MVNGQIADIKSTRALLSLLKNTREMICLLFMTLLFVYDVFPSVVV